MFGFIRRAFRPKAQTAIASSDAVQAYLAGQDRSNFRISARKAEAVSVIHRCVSLISGTVQKLVTPDNLRVENRKGSIIETRAALRSMALLSESPDGENPASEMLARVFTDMLVFGDGLIAIDRSFDGTPVKLVPLCRQNARTLYRRGILYYEATPLFGPSAASPVRYPRSSIIRAAIPNFDHIGPQDGLSWAPIEQLSSALQIYLEGDDYISDFFRTGILSNVQLNIERAEQPTPEQAEQIRQAAFKKGPIVTYQTKAVPLNLTQNIKDITALRTAEVLNIARYYGVPSSYINEEENLIGSGIEALRRAFWSDGVAPNLQPFLSDSSSPNSLRGANPSR